MSKKQSSEDRSAKQADRKVESGATAKAVKASQKEESRGLAAKLGAFKEYLVLSRAELNKVSWPTWKETRTTTLVVLGFVVVMAILLGLADLVFSGIIRFILS